MKNFKSSLLILVAVLLVVSSAMMFAVFYHLYNNGTVNATALEKERQRNSQVISSKDSLLKLYSILNGQPAKVLDSALNNADSLKGLLDAKLLEFYNLQKEISAVLKDSSANSNKRIAQQKISRLQQKMDVLRIGNRANVLVGGGAATDKEIQVKDNEEKRLAASTNAGSDVFILSDLHFSAIQISNNKEEPTFKANETEKLSGNFKIKSKRAQSTTSEIMIVVVQPDGKVVQNSTWETGTFETTEGKKIYSSKLRFDYNAGELKQLNFSLTPDRYLPGNYIIKVYHNGILIGKTDKTLS